MSPSEHLYILYLNLVQLGISNLCSSVVIVTSLPAWWNKVLFQQRQFCKISSPSLESAQPVPVQ